MDKIPIVVIAGPTASGKTALAVEIAKRIGGEIVSADSMQIYKYMDIGTAKPTEEEKGGVVHHLMDFLDPRCEYSVADYVEDAGRCIDDISARKKLAVVAGGTGLYIDSLIGGVTFEENCSDGGIRQELAEIGERDGSGALMEMLKKIDPESAERIHPNNVRRVIRAIEYYRVTGKTITEHNAEKKESRYKPLFMAVDWEREKLYKRIEKRVDIMLDAGLLDEVRRLIDMGCTKKMQSMQGIGYKQLLDYYRGFSNLDEAARIIKRDSRRYAKRQLTWFRRNENIYMLDADGDILKQAWQYTQAFLENEQKFAKI